MMMRRETEMKMMMESGIDQVKLCLLSFVGWHCRNIVGKNCLCEAHHHTSKHAKGILPHSPISLLEKRKLETQWESNLKEMERERWREMEMEMDK